MKKYILPPSLKSSFEEDPILAQIKEQGEKQKMPEVSFYQAVVLALLEQRNYFMVETFRYTQQFGPLPPLENHGNNTATIQHTEPRAEAEEEVPKKEFPPLKVVPKTEEQSKRFSKSYE